MPTVVTALCKLRKKRGERKWRKPYHSCHQGSLGFTVESRPGQQQTEQDDTEKERPGYGNPWPNEAFENQGKKEGYLSTAAMLNGHRTVNMMGLSTLETKETYCS